MADVTLTFTDIQDEAKGSIKLVKFTGQLDETNIEEEAKKFYDVLEAENIKNVIFDFSELSYLNSKSIGYIADWQGKVTQAGGKLVIYGAAENIFDILDVVGLTQLIEMKATQEEAQAAL